MKTAVYPGSFDPVTMGHLDIVHRTSQIFDKVIIGVLNNRAKSPLFSVEERVQSFAGLLIDFVRQNHAQIIVRGLRAITDFEYELQMAQTNRVMAPEVDTLFLTTNLRYSYLSSSIVKEIAAGGGDITAFVHPYVAEQMKRKLFNQ